MDENLLDKNYYHKLIQEEILIILHQKQFNNLNSENYMFNPFLN